MCLDCGCGKAHDDMGEPEIHLTYEDIKRAAEADGQTVRETLETIVRTLDRDQAAHPQEY
jgi:hypothetical protein